MTGKDPKGNEAGGHVTTLCPCSKPAPNGYLCKACGRRLEQRYAELPSLMDDLTTTLVRQDNIGERSEGTRGKVSAPALIVSLEAADVFADLTRNLTVTVRHLVAKGEHLPCGCGHAHSQHYTVIPFVRACWWRRCRCSGYTATETLSARRMATWLQRRVPALLKAPEAPQILEGMDAVTARLIDVINIPADLRRFSVGRCPETDTAGAQCPGEIRAHIPRDEHEPPRMECTVCHIVYDTPQWARAGKRIKPRPRPGGQIRGPLLVDTADRRIRPAQDGELGPYPDGSLNGGRDTDTTYGTDAGTITEIARLTHVPSGTIRRWLSEGRLTRRSDNKPYLVSYDEVLELRDTL